MTIRTPHTCPGSRGRKHQMNLALNLKEQLCCLELRLRGGRNKSFRFTKVFFKKLKMERSPTLPRYNVSIKRKERFVLIRTLRKLTNIPEGFW